MTLAFRHGCVVGIIDRADNASGLDCAVAETTRRRMQPRRGSVITRARLRPSRPLTWPTSEVEGRIIGVLGAK